MSNHRTLVQLFHIYHGEKRGKVGFRREGRNCALVAGGRSGSRGRQTSVRQVAAIEVLLGPHWHRHETTREARERDTVSQIKACSRFRQRLLAAPTLPRDDGDASAKVTRSPVGRLAVIQPRSISGGEVPANFFEGDCETLRPRSPSFVFSRKSPSNCPRLSSIPVHAASLLRGRGRNSKTPSELHILF